MRRLVLLALVFGGFAIGQPVYYTYSSPGDDSGQHVFPPSSFEIVSQDGFLPTSVFSFPPGSPQLAYCDAGNGVGCGGYLLQLTGQSQPTVFSAILPVIKPNDHYTIPYFEDFTGVSLQQLGTYAGAQGGTLTVSYTEPVPEPASYALIGAGLLLFSFQWVRQVR